MRDPSSDIAIADAYGHHCAGRRAEAETLCREVLEREPGHAGATHLLAAMAHAQKRLGPALKLARIAVAAAPAVSGYRNTLGIILGDLRRWDECLAEFAEAVRLDPASFEAHRNLGIALSKAGRLEESATPLRRAAEIRPGEPAIWSLLASLHHGLLDLPAAIDCRRRAVALRPDDFRAHSDLLVTLHYSAEYSAEQLFEEHLGWARRHEVRSAGFSPYVVTDATQLRAEARTTNDPLRVGYLSGDFRNHPMPRFFLPVLTGHDRTRITVHCYSDVVRPDAQTERIRAQADVWRDVSALDDDAVAALIRSDRIDVLVDLAGHLENRRLLVFARRPAPVQVSYIGYPNTTGMRSMQYRITDGFHDPVSSSAFSGRCPIAVVALPLESAENGDGASPAKLGSASAIPSVDSFHTERLVRLPGCCWAYDPGDDPLPPEVGPLPALTAGRVTFAVFNRLIKVSAPMARLWSRILQRLPGSRLLVLDSAGAGEASIRRSLGRLGLEAPDIGVIPRGTRAEYLTRYNEVDIALDTFPYAGMTTTCDALWMGVPTVTLAGQTHVSRTGVSLLSAVGLPELIAWTPEEYIEIAVRLASDLPRLSALRAGLRERMRGSPLCDGRRLAREIESAYREMWTEYCAATRDDSR